MFNHDLVKTLVNLGRDGILLGKKIDRNALYELGRDASVGGLTFDKLVFLIRGVVLLEQDTSLYCFGSTTIVGRLFTFLKNKRFDRKDQVITDLMNWTLANRANVYIPFNTSVPLEVKSIKAYENYLNVCELHRKKMKEEQVLKSLLAKEKKRKMSLTHQTIAQQKNEERELVTKRLKKLSVVSRLNYIVASDKSINFFPEQFAELTSEEFQKIPSDLLIQLKKKIKYAQRKSAWRLLKNVLVSI